MQPVPSTKEPSWIFQLPDLLKSNSRSEVEMIEHIHEIDPFRQDGKASNEKVLKSSAKESDETKIDRTIGIVGGAVAMKNITESEVDTTSLTPLASIDNKSYAGNALEEWKSSLALPPASSEPPNDAQLSAPLTLLDCIEQEKQHIPSSSSGKLSSNGDADGTAESQQTWLPPSMLDSKDYDFPDRRQRY